MWKEKKIMGQKGKQRERKRSMKIRNTKSREALMNESMTQVRKMLIPGAGKLIVSKINDI